MKHKPMITSLAILIVLSLGIGIAAAQEPEPSEPITAQAALGTAFTYQGRLTDGGSPANGEYDFRFRLYDASSGGSQVGSTDTLGNVTVTEGLFTVQLDFGSGAFNGDARYLEIGVRPGSSSGAYTTLTPRQALTPAPYALALPGLWTQQNATSPNLIGGYSGNSVTAGAYGATIGGGGSSISPNQVTADYATVGGGSSNEASGDYATVPGGHHNVASGDYSFAAGYRAKANHDGSFVLADSTDADFTSVRENALRVRFNGGATFVVNDDYWVRFWSSGGRLIEASNGAHLTTGGVWTNASDRDAKEDFAPVDGQEVLARLAEVPITTWSYKAEDPSVRRMGPTAQDFYAAFGLGGDERHISTVDADGVALASIQELYRLYREQKAENAALRQQVSDLEARLAALEQVVSGGPQAGGGER